MAKKKFQRGDDESQWIPWLKETEFVKLDLVKIIDDPLNPKYREDKSLVEPKRR